MKKFGLHLAIAAMVLLSAAMAQASLVSLYTFDDTTDVNTLGINAVDAAYNGTAMNGVGTVAGIAGSGAVTFSGGTDAATSAYIAMPALAIPEAFRNSNSGSVSYWAKGNLSGGDYQVLGMTGVGADGQMLHIATGNGSFLVYALASGPNVDGVYPQRGQIPLRTAQANVWPDNTNWHLVTTTWALDPATSADATPKGRANVYIDSTAYALTVTYTTNYWRTNTTWGTSMGMGQEHRINGTKDTETNPYWMKDGQAVDDFGMWSTELTAAQATALNNLARNALDYNAQNADALFNLYVNGGSAVIGGQTWSKYGTGTAFDGTGALTGGVGNAVLALGASGGVQSGTPVGGDRTWTGHGMSGDWADANNWSPSGPPTMNDAAIFDDSATGWLINTVSASVSPESVVYNNSTNPYVLMGLGGITGPTTLLKQGTAKVTIRTSNSYTGVTTLDAAGGTLQLDGSGAWNPVLNLAGTNIKAGKMVFDYAGGSSPGATIGALMKESYHSGSSTHWDIGQFRSTTADAERGLGWKDVAGQVTVAYTWYGDVTLNGTVDISDLSAMGQNWNGTGKVWAQGDFNYDGNVDIADLSRLGQGWGKKPPPTGFGSSIGSDSGAVVPEPGSIVLLAAGAIGLLAWAWRRRQA